MEKFIKIPIPEGFDFKTEIVDGYITHKWVKIDNKKTFDEMVDESIRNLVKSGKANCLTDRDTIAIANKDEQTILKQMGTCEEIKSALMLNQLIQLAKHPIFNGDWEADYTNDNQSKYCFYICDNNLCNDTSNLITQKISFKSCEIRSKFREFVGDEKIILALS